MALFYPHQNGHMSSSKDEAESWVTDLCLSEESMSNLIERSQESRASNVIFLNAGGI